MSETTETEAPKEQILAQKDGIKYVKKEFTDEEGKIPKGFGFAAPQVEFSYLEVPRGTDQEGVKTLRATYLEALKKALSATVNFIGKGNEVTGHERLLESINTSFAADTRQFVSRQQPTFPKEQLQAKTNHFRELATKFTDKIIWGVDKAMEWYPGMRNTTEVGLLKESFEALKVGNKRLVFENALKIARPGISREELDSELARMGL